MYIDLFSCILVSLGVSIYLSHECRERRSISMYIGLYSCVLVSFHASWSLLTCRYTSSLSNVDVLQVYLSRKEFSFVLFFGLFSCFLVSFHVYWSLLTCRHTESVSIAQGVLFCLVCWSLLMFMGLFTCILVSFQVSWSLLTCRYVSSLSNIDVPLVAFGVSFKSQSPISISLVSFQRNVVKET